MKEFDKITIAISTIAIVIIIGLMSIGVKELKNTHISVSEIEVTETDALVDLAVQMEAANLNEELDAWNF